jgi:hypothetical protein
LKSTLVSFSAAFLLAGPALAQQAPLDVARPAVQAFVAQMHADHGIEPQETVWVLRDAVPQPRIIEIMQRPAESTLARFRELLPPAPRGEGFGNGRFARNTLEAAIGHQAWRLRDVAEPTVDQLREILAEDLVDEQEKQRDDEARLDVVPQLSEPVEIDPFPALDDLNLKGSPTETISDADQSNTAEERNKPGSGDVLPNAASTAGTDPDSQGTEHAR